MRCRPVLLENRKIVVTGGTGGIGRHVVGQLLDEKAVLLVVSRSDPGITGVGHLPADLSLMSEVERAAQQVAAWTPDILINLAGDQFFGEFETQPSRDVLSSYLLNIVAPTILSQAVLPAMKAAGDGQIVNVGSIFGSISYPHFVTYSVAKAGLFALSQALRRELEGSGVSVTHIAPRAVASGLNRGAVARFVEMANMAADRPEKVAQRIVQAVRAKKRDVFIGFPESLFVRLNALAPRLVDRGLEKQTDQARMLLMSGLSEGD